MVGKACTNFFINLFANRKVCLQVQIFALPKKGALAFATRKFGFAEQNLGLQVQISDL